MPLFRRSEFPAPCVMGDESIMSPKSHGTSDVPVQHNLRWKCDRKTADRICNFNRHYAERSGYFLGQTSFLSEMRAESASSSPTTRGGEGRITFYDSNTGKPLFVAPVGRTTEDFLDESKKHGWPSFRDEEVVWENVRCLRGGEAVSVDGTHLGHNLPDRKGNRYCINLVSVAGRPVEDPLRKDGKVHVDEKEVFEINPRKKNGRNRFLQRVLGGGGDKTKHRDAMGATSD